MGEEPEDQFFDIIQGWPHFST